MLRQSETTKSSRKVKKFLLEVQHCKLSNMGLKIWESSAILICDFLTQWFNNLPDIEFYIIW